MVRRKFWAIFQKPNIYDVKIEHVKIYVPEKVGMKIIGWFNGSRETNWTDIEVLFDTGVKHLFENLMMLFNDVNGGVFKVSQSYFGIQIRFWVFD